MDTNLILIKIKKIKISSFQALHPDQCYTYINYYFCISQHLALNQVCIIPLKNIVSYFINRKSNILSVI